jgi:hypothetical protein
MEAAIAVSRQSSVVSRQSSVVSRQPSAVSRQPSEFRQQPFNCRFLFSVAREGAQPDLS